MVSLSKPDNSKIKRRQQLEIRQLKHDLQLAKVELTQREFQLTNIKHEYESRFEILQEKAGHLVHQNQLLNTQLSSLNAVCNL